MKKSILLSAMLFAAVTASGQGDAESYLKYTKNAKPASAVAAADTAKTKKEKARDVMNEKFPYRGLCEWEPGMRFMVVPDKRDLVIRTFTDSVTGQKVSNSPLRHKIFVYTGHDDLEGHGRVHFRCEEDQRRYYYEVPTGSFDDYCLTKFGVPALAYLGDVDIARKELLGKTLTTKALKYYRDVEYGSDGAEEVTMEGTGHVVKVVAIGVGTRRFPVKIIVSGPTKKGDKTEQEFYQYVAISRTNCGLRGDEFSLRENQNHTFETAFDMKDDLASAGAYAGWVGKTVCTNYATQMRNASDKLVTVARLSVFVIDKISLQSDSRYAKLTLRQANNSKVVYTKDVLFSGMDGTSSFSKPEQRVFEKLFIEGDPTLHPDVKPQHLAAITRGNIQVGFTEAEVRLSRPDEPSVIDEGDTVIWLYNHYNTRRARVVFSKLNHRVISVKM